MPITIIDSNPSFKKEVDKTQSYLKIAEMFSRTCQGEGISVGIPASFLRLKDCTLDCVWCDSASVWKFGNPYSIIEVLDLLEKNGTVDDFHNGHHWILTGGSPLLQEKSLIILIDQFVKRFGFKPFIEVENECVLDPSGDFIGLVDQWNNSPKLVNSEMKTRIRYKPTLLQRMSMFNNSWFKFVISKEEEDWKEIEEMFLPFIKKEQIILMPEGIDQEQLNERRQKIVELAIRKNVRFSDRLHITIFDRMVGV